MRTCEHTSLTSSRRSCIYNSREACESSCYISASASFFCRDAATDVVAPSAYSGQSSQLRGPSEDNCPANIEQGNLRLLCRAYMSHSARLMPSLPALFSTSAISSSLWNFRASLRKQNSKSSLLSSYFSKKRVTGVPAYTGSSELS